MGNVPYNMGEAGMIFTQSSELCRLLFTGPTYRRLQIRWPSRRFQVRYFGEMYLYYIARCRLVFDRETNKPKGYGFCEFAGTDNSTRLFKVISFDV